jgi:hypothetical protein
VYIKTLADVDVKVLAKLVASAAAEKKRQHALIDVPRAGHASRQPASG